jgi:esterase/lipase superfamily enzyme
LELSKEVTIKFLETELPRPFLTIARKKPFWVVYDKSQLVFFNGKKQFKVNIIKLHELIVDVLFLKSLVVSDYSLEHRNVSYLLPIIAKMLSVEGENINDYLAQFNSWEREMKSLDNLTSVDEFHERLENKFVAKSVASKIENCIRLEMHSEVPEIPYVISEVFYATNRKSVGGKDHFGPTRQKEMNYGVVNVSIPKEHLSGRVERPSSVFRLELKENKKKHFSIDKGWALKQSEFYCTLSTRSNKRSLMLFIHGYNVSFKNAVFKAAQLKYDLNYEDPFVVFSWPSQSKVLGYAADKEQALYSSNALAELLNEITNLEIEEVLVVAHSMGSFCLAEAINKINTPSKEISKLVLAAPDISKQAFKEEYGDSIKQFFKNITLYASSKDKALISSNYVNKADRLGDAGSNISVTDGLETVDMSDVDHGFFSLNHSYVSENNIALTDIHNFLINGIPAASRRLKSKSNQNQQMYWMMHV